MNANSSEQGPLHPSMVRSITIRRAHLAEAASVATYLREQGDPPSPDEADVAIFLERSDTALLCALQDGRIAGIAGLARDGPVIRLVYFAVCESESEDLAHLLISAVENLARSQGVALLAAQVRRESQIHRCLRRCGFEINWQEADVVAGRLVTLVDLVKVL